MQDRLEFINSHLCFVGAAVAVGATAAAAAAAQAAQAANAPGAPDIAVPTFDRRENELIRQTRSSLDQGRTQTELGSGLLSRLEPELLRALGFDVQTSGVDPAQLQAAQDRVASLQSAIGEAESTRIGAKGRKSKGGSPKARKTARKERNRLQQELDLAQAELGRLQSNPMQVTGLSRAPSEAELQQGQIETGLGDRVLTALGGELAASPALTREFEEQEKVLRSKLARDFGPDFESSTVGAANLQNFYRARDEAFENDRRNTLAQLVGLQSGLSSDILNRTLARQEGASAIGRNRLTSGEAFQNLGQAFTNAQQPFQSLRGAKTQRDIQQAQLDQQAEEQRQAMISGAIQSGSQALGAGAGVAAGGFGGAGSSSGNVANILSDPRFTPGGRL